MFVRMTLLKVKHYMKWNLVFFLEEIDGNCEISRIGDNSIHFLVIWPINKLVDNKGVILRVKEKFKEPPKEMVIWDVI